MSVSVGASTSSMRESDSAVAEVVEVGVGNGVDTVKSEKNEKDRHSGGKISKKFERRNRKFCISI